MSPDDLRTLLRRSGADLWNLIESALSLAAREHPRELRSRRDGIVERLYSAAAAAAAETRSDAPLAINGKASASSPSTPQSENRADAVAEEEDDEEETVRYRRSRDRIRNDVEEDEEEAEDDGNEDGEREEQTKILAIKEQLEEPDQDEDTMLSLLQNLVDMDITFKALQETDIGRYVNALRKHPSGEVRNLVRLLVRKWKVLVDHWVKLNSNESSGAAIIDGDSPAKSFHNEHRVSDFSHSPYIPNGNMDLEPKQKLEATRSVPTPPIKQRTAPAALPSSVPPKSREPQKDNLMDPERLASARKRLQENYQEAQNAKKQRTIQVMGIHEIPIKKNTFIPKGKQGKHW